MVYPTPRYSGIYEIERSSYNSPIIFLHKAVSSFGVRACPKALDVPLLTSSFEFRVLGLGLGSHQMIWGSDCLEYQG